MGLLTRAYNSDNSPHIATVVLSIGSALLFSVGLFLIVNAQFSKQAKTLKSAQTTINKLENDKDPEFDTITVNEESNLNGDLNVGGSTTLSGDLSVNGAGSVNTVLGVDGDTNFDQTLDVKGGVLLKGDMSVLGATTLQSSVAVGGDTSLGEGLTIGGSLNGKGDFSSSGATTIRGSVSVGGDTTFDLSTGGAFTLQGGFSTNGDLSIAGTTVLQQGLSVSGNESTSTFDGTGVSNGNTVVLGSGPSFQVQGSSSLKGDVNVLGTTLLNGPLEVTGMAVATDFIPTTTFDATGSSNGSTILLGGTSLTVAGATTLKGDFNLNGTAQFSDTLLVTGINNTSTDFTPSITFDARGETNSNNVITTTLLGGTSGANATFKVTNGVTLQGDTEIYGTTSIGDALLVQSANGNFPETTFDARNADSTALLGGGVSFAVTNGITTQGDLTVYGTVTAASLGVTGDVEFDSRNADGSAFLGNQPSFVVAGTTTITGDPTINGTTLLQSTLTVNGLATYEGDLYAKCTNGVGNLTACTNTIADVGGRIFAGNVWASNHVSAPEFGINLDGGPTYTPGSQHRTCAAGTHLEIDEVWGGLVMTTNGGNCVRNQGGASGGGVTPASTQNCSPPGYPNHIVIVTRVVDGLVVEQNNCGNASGLDYAENYPSNQALLPGDVVAIDTSNSEYVVKSNSKTDSKTIGVISTEPGYVLGQDIPNSYPVALAGRVPVNVTNEGGAIAPGDYLTSSSTPGFAMKAGPNDKTIGQALEAFNGTSGQVKMFVSVSKEAPVNSPMQGSQLLSQGGDANLASLNVSGMTELTELKVTGSATIVNLTVTGTASLTDIIVNGHIIGNPDTRGSVVIPAGQTTIHHDFAKPFDVEPTVVASPVGQATLYNLTASATGFDITVPNPTAADQKFNYLVQQ